MMKSVSTAPLNQVLLRLLGIGVLIPCVFIGLALLAINTYLNANTIQREQYQITSTIAWKADEYIANAKRSLNTVAILEETSTPAELQRILGAIQETRLYFDNTLILNKNGVITADSPLDMQLLNLDMSNQSYFKSRNSKQAYQISSPFLSPETGKLTVYLTYNLNDGGLVVGELSLNRLQQAIDTIPLSGGNQSIYISDGHGNLLAQPKSASVQQTNLSSINQLMTPISYLQHIYFDNHQILIGTQTKLSQVGWTVTAQIPLAVAFSPYLIPTIISLVLFIILWIFLTLRLRTSFTRQIVNPLTRLSQNANALAFGDLSKSNLPTVPASFREVGELAFNFARMFQAIQTRQTMIEDNELKYRSLIEQSNDAICLEVQNRLEVINQKFTDLFGITIEAISNQPIRLSQIAATASKKYVEDQQLKLTLGSVNSLHYEFTALDKGGQEIYVEVSSSAFLYRGGTAIQVTLRDVTDRKRAEKAEHEQRILAEALRDTASALNSTLNFDELMERILSNLGKVVFHDSSNIMLINDDNETAQFVAARGYKEEDSQKWLQSGIVHLTDVPNLYTMYLTGKSMAVPDTASNPEWVVFPRSSWIRSYTGAPIKVKDRVIGFLNLNSPIPGFFNDEMAAHLQAFADQAGVALNNARLLQDLRKSNLELLNAYETTLQGWSKALELRDYGTEGHTLRVLDMTVKLAKKLGITDPELTHIRHGCLLHDIGKIGIPDSILTKAGPLTEEEWEIMRRHPVYAYEILSPIPYLAPSLDIPYYHHEWWDGSGYPQGLKGKQIPLVARIFSIVDVWDGLRENRPYRQGMPESEVVEYLQGQSGIQFDPEIVRAFVKLLCDEGIYCLKQEKRAS
jgi:PAS domain S-box-containing protein